MILLLGLFQDHKFDYEVKTAQLEVEEVEIDS